jgi:hypothetical protein
MKRTWHDNFLLLLDRLPTERIVLLRDLLTALAARRVAEDARLSGNIEMALSRVAGD